MRLCLIQHAKALSKQEDPERPLSKEGKAELAKICKFIEPLKFEVGEIWHSEKLRTQQTAKELAAVVKSSEGCVEKDNIGAKDNPVPVKEAVESGDKDLMIVGHLPFLDKFASLLLADAAEAGIVDFQNAGIVYLESDEDGGWSVEWILVPQMLV
jgi:phosphohistidine phosphatase